MSEGLAAVERRGSLGSLSTDSGSSSSTTSSATRQRRSSSSSSSGSKFASITLRCRVIIDFAVCLLLIFALLILAAGATMSSAFVAQEEDFCNLSVLRAARSFQSTLGELSTSVVDYSVWSDSVDALLAFEAGNMTKYEQFVESNFGEINTIFGYNLFAAWSRNGTFLFGAYNPPVGNTTTPSSVSTELPTELRDPSFPARFLHDSNAHAGLLKIPGFESMLASAHAFQVDSTSSETFGTLLFAVHAENTLQFVAELGSCCATILDPSDDPEAFEELSSGNAENDANASEWGINTFVKKIKVKSTNENGRVCHSGWTPQDDSRLRAGFMLLRDDIHNASAIVRVDHFERIVFVGTVSMMILLALSILSLILFGSLFVVLLDRSVLRRLGEIHSMLFYAWGSSSAMSLPRSSTASDSRSGSISGSIQKQDPVEQRKQRNEINRLKKMLKMRLKMAATELAASSASLGQRRVETKQLDDALALLNVLCSRDSELPEVVLPSAGKPLVVSLEGILANPFAVQFLKAHCKETGNGHSGLLFLLDLAQLRNIFEDPKTTERAGGVAASIYRRFLAKNAPLALEFDEGMRKRINKAVATCKASQAIAAYEVLATDVAEYIRVNVLPQFEETPAYTNMFRVLRTEIGGGELVGPFFSEREQQVQQPTPRPSTQQIEEETAEKQEQGKKEKKKKSKTHKKRKQKAVKSHRRDEEGKATTTTTEIYEDLPTSASVSPATAPSATPHEEAVELTPISPQPAAPAESSSMAPLQLSTQTK